MSSKSTDVEAEKDACNTTTGAKSQNFTIQQVETKNKNTLKLDIFTILELTEMGLSNRIRPIKKLFDYELRQVNLLIAIISKCKDKPICFYLGMTLKQIVKQLKYYDKYFLFKSELYVLHLLELMSAPHIGILEFSEGTSSYNLTMFGSIYYNYGERTTKDC